MMQKSEIKNLILSTIDKVNKYIEKSQDEQLLYIDPNEGVEISAHYGASHTAASFVIWGNMTLNSELQSTGLKLLESIIANWSLSSKSSDFHADFNNFALCLVTDYVEDELLLKQIKDIVLATPDSNHYTINWIPMRLYVNKKRYQWTLNEKYLKIVERCSSLVENAINLDGGIEDRLPKGVSFNLQYDISTIAELLLLNNIGIHWNLSKELGFLINSLLPDGDINYHGRGCNQIFAWGPWIYLIAATSHKDILEKALNYLTAGDKIKKMLDNNNMMLNDYNGQEHLWWWDYHYASVYMAHFLLWLVLSYRDYDKFSITPEFSKNNDTGLYILKSEDAFVEWFNGRSEYLSERGPAISAIWTKRHGTIFKGVYGPWYGLFGNKYVIDDLVLKNSLGLIQTSTCVDFHNSRILHRIFKKLQFPVYLKTRPLFIPLSVKVTQTEIIINWLVKQPVAAYFNAALGCKCINMTLMVDGTVVPIIIQGTINNQYGLRYLYQSRTLKGLSWELRIKI